MNALTKLILLAWLAIGGVIGAGSYGVASLSSASSTLLSYSGFVSPVSVFGGFTVLYGLIAWRIGAGRMAKAAAAIIRDKPGLASDASALKREVRIRQKEFKLQKQEERALKKENRAEKKEAHLERKRERIHEKKAVLEERDKIGR